MSLTIPTALTEKEMMRLIVLAQSARVIELGSWYGASTLALASSAHSVHSIDWHQGDEHAGYGDTLHQYLYNVATCHNVFSHIGRFADVLPAMRRGYFELAFIDGQHDSLSVTEDFKLVKPTLVKGAVVAFHDYGRYEVQDAVDALFGKPDELVDTLAIVRV